MVKRGLGKGFDALIPTDVLDEDFDTTAAEDEKVSDLRVLSIDDIVKMVDELIAAHGDWLPEYK